MTDRETRLEVLMQIIAHADKFPSIDPKTREYVPMSITEAIICADVMAGYIESGKVPGDEEWSRHDAPLQNLIEEAETATKN